MVSPWRDELKSKNRILIVDDEPNIRKILQASFERANYSATVAESGEAALLALENVKYDLVLTDVFMPGMTGLELLEAVRKRWPSLPVVILTAFGTIPQAVDAVRAGAADYVTKPFDLEQLKKTVAFWVNSSKLQANSSSVERTNLGKSLIAESPQMRSVLDLVSRVADSRTTVLITGESGTGKEVIAKEIHRSGQRSDKAFVAVNAAALPDTLLESELFGYVRGAFTGADADKPGRFEMADKGTLFLDEVGELPPSTQVKLLRVLQEREFERLGANTPTPVDVRLITATNRSLEQAVIEGSFRQDLLYRLKVLQIELPPLRQRKEDIEPLALHFLAKYAKENERQLSSIQGEALAALQSHTWPGNVRELENVIERAVVLAMPNETRLSLDLLPPALQAAA